MGVFTTMREDPEKEFAPIFDSMLAMAEIVGSGRKPIPKTCHGKE